MLEFLRRPRNKSSEDLESGVAAPFIVGAARSGTTLLRLMLDAHPDVAIPAETGFFITLASAAARGSYPSTPDQLAALLTRSHTWSDLNVDQAEFEASLGAISDFSISKGLRQFYGMYATKHGKLRWGDKSPHHCYHIPAILQTLPEARIIHIIRDGRDVALSLREVWFSPGREPAMLAEAWRSAVGTARQAGAECPNYLEVRYEQLVREPRAVLEGICDHLGLGFSETMLTYHETAKDRLDEVRDSIQPDGRTIAKSTRLDQHRLTSFPPEPERIGRWHDGFTRDELTEFESVAGALLKDLGYSK
jgi:hypothetical protein